MNYVIAVFKSRKEAMAFGTAMMRNGARVAAVNTPPSIGSSCGLSVKFERNRLPLAQRVLSGEDYFTFKGFYEV